MAERQEATIVTCLPSVQPTNPTKSVVLVDGGTIRKIRIVIPAGHAGLTGIALGYGGNAVVPRSTGAYYQGDDRIIELDFTDNVPDVPWQAFMYNLDTLNAHSWEVDFDLDDSANDLTATAQAVISPAAIVAAGTEAMSGA